MDAKITENDLWSTLPNLTTTMRLPELGAAADVCRDWCRIDYLQINRMATNTERLHFR